MENMLGPGRVFGLVLVCVSVAAADTVMTVCGGGVMKQVVSGCTGLFHSGSIVPGGRDKAFIGTTRETGFVRELHRARKRERGTNLHALAHEY